MKKILFAASEAVPFVKTGGLADVVGSLPKYFDKKKYDVRIILPKYACMEEKFKKQLKYVSHFYVELGWRKQYAGILEALVDDIHYYFIDNEFYFAGDKPYGEIYQDVEKFAFFSKAVIEAVKRIRFVPDIIHCNDWQTGLIPVFLKNVYHKQEEYKKIRTIFSIHNIRFQGRWMIPTVKDITGLPDKLFTADCLETYGESNYLKGGIVSADAVTTVSKSYAMEIMTPEGGEGLDGVLRQHSYKLFGILNGLDYEEFNPQKDKYIPYNFDSQTVFEEKAKNKAILQEKMGLPVKKDVFLVGMVSRMSDQKGFDLVDYMLDEILYHENIQLVVLGTGEDRYENMFRHFAGKYPDKMAANVGYSEEMAHLIYAGADAFLMPSLFEPCGLSQLMSLRYGTVPMVRETGGLKDTVEPYNKYEGTGTGFSFANYNAHEMAAMLRTAMEVYYKEAKEWKDLMLRGMQQDYSWISSVSEYELLYQSVGEIMD
ncbi:MAG: glycogen synthase GlgA [Lachnospiraceae bacterium]|nr:glycogen synthase GlgA [Lachnospiraceae bacterium]